MSRKLLPALAVFAFLAACSTDRWAVDSYQAPQVDVAARRSFAWREGEVGAPLIKQPAIAADTRQRMRAMITQELALRGYAEAADAAQADMVVSFQVTGSRRFVESDQRRIGAPSPNELLTPGGVPPLPASELPREKSVRQGTVIVFVEHPASGDLVWRGLVNAEIRVSSLDKTVDQVIDMGRHIMQAFPSRSTAR